MPRAKSSRPVSSTSIAIPISPSSSIPAPKARSPRVSRPRSSATAVTAAPRSRVPTRSPATSTATSPTSRSTGRQCRLPRTPAGPPCRQRRPPRPERQPAPGDHRSRRPPGHPGRGRPMEHLLEEGLEAGAFGFSTGLEYPSERATTEAETICLCHVIARRGGLYTTHTRNRDVHAVAAIEEAVRVAHRRTSRSRSPTSSPAAAVPRTSSIGRSTSSTAPAPRSRCRLRRPHPQEALALLANDLVEHAAEGVGRKQRTVGHAAGEGNGPCCACRLPPPKARSRLLVGRDDACAARQQRGPVQGRSGTGHGAAGGA